MNEPVTEQDQQARNKSRRTILLLALLFGIPYLAAFYFYFSDEASQSLNTSNNGQLVSPVRPMASMIFLDMNSNKEVPISFDKGWTLLTLASSNCDKTCINNLYAMKQVRRAVGVDRNKVYRIMLLTDEEHTANLMTRLDDFPGMDVVTTSAENLQILQSKLQLDSQSLNNAIFLFDPYGNYMMYYAPSTHPKLLLKDIQLLLKVSND